MSQAFFEQFKIGYRKGETIFKQGELGTEMYIVRSGRVKIYRMVGEKEIVFANLEKGDFFGEMAVLENLPREAAAFALEDVELIAITSSTFEKMIKANIEIAVRMLRKFSEHLRRANAEIERYVQRTGLPGEMKSPEAFATAAPPARPVESAPEIFAALKPVLIVKGKSKKYPIKGPAVTIGREDPVTGLKPEIDLTSEDINRFISRRHARILYKEETFFLVEEVGVTNGTFLNGKRLQAGVTAPIKFGDEICLGKVYLMFDQDR